LSGGRQICPFRDENSDAFCRASQARALRLSRAMANNARVTRSRQTPQSWLLSAAIVSALSACSGFAGDDAAAPTRAGDPSTGAGGNSSGAPPGTSPSPGPSNAGVPGGGTAAPQLPLPAPTTQPPMGSNTGDKYNAPGTNPFVMTSHDPFSTFAVDVDSASYDIFRRDVKRGALPQAASVRLEEFVNAFPYEYAAPSDEDAAPFTVSVAAASQVFDRPTTLLRVGIQGRKPKPFEKRAANIVYLVDVSGSMGSPDKLPLAKNLLIDSLNVLDPADKVSVVTYAGETSVRLAPTAVAQRANIEPVLNGLQIGGGGTNGAGGLTLAYQQAAQGFINEGINHIVMLTDGDFNVGVSSTKEMLQIIRDKRKTGVTLTVIGFGVGNLNDDMMEAVSNAGNGIYSLVEDQAAAGKYVREKLLSTLDHIAKDVKIQVEFNSEAVSAYRLLGYENRALADSDFRMDGVDAGEIGAGHRVTALYELVPTGGVIPLRVGAPAPVEGTPSTLTREISANELVRVKVRWKTVFATELTPADELAFGLTRDAVKVGLAAADLDLQWATAVAGFAELLKGSPYADRAWLPTITSVVNAQTTRDPDRREFAELFNRALTLMPR
jgi:Ca-activated chloride channel family protein